MVFANTVGGGGKIVFGREKKIVRKKNSITACFTCLQLNVTLLYICVCEYAYIRMTDHDHRTYEAIRTYIHKFVWVCARVATNKKMYIQIRMNIYVCIYTQPCLQLNVTLLYICVCEYTYIRMTDHDHRTDEAIRTYIHKYVLVWVCAHVATKKKKYIQIDGL
jgi:hypothetical protein